MFGIQADFDGLRIRPCMPAAWEEVHAERMYRGARYKIAFRNGGKGTGDVHITLDGQAIDGDLLPKPESPDLHTVDVEIG